MSHWMKKRQPCFFFLCPNLQYNKCALQLWKNNCSELFLSHSEKYLWESIRCSLWRDPWICCYYKMPHWITTRQPCFFFCVATCIMLQFVVWPRPWNWNFPSQFFPVYCFHVFFYQCWPADHAVYTIGMVKWF